MRKAFKWIGIGCGGLFGLFVIIVVIAALVSGGGSDESEVSVAGDTSGEAQADETKSLTPVSNEESRTEPLPTSTPVPNGKSRAEPLPRGYSITHDDFKVTVLDISYSSSEGGIFTALKENHVWATVKLRLEAVGDSDKTFSYHTWNFRIVGDMGVIYDDKLIASTDDDLGSGEVFGGAVIEGNVVQQVHKDDANLILIFAPAFKGSRYLALESSP